MKYCYQKNHNSKLFGFWNPKICVIHPPNSCLSLKQTNKQKISSIEGLGWHSHCHLLAGIVTRPFRSQRKLILNFPVITYNWIFDLVLTIDSQIRIVSICYPIIFCSLTPEYISMQIFDILWLWNCSVPEGEEVICYSSTHSWELPAYWALTDSTFHPARLGLLFYHTECATAISENSEN